MKIDSILSNAFGSTSKTAPSFLSEQTESKRIDAALKPTHVGKKDGDRAEFSAAGLQALDAESSKDLARTDAFQEAGTDNKEQSEKAEATDLQESEQKTAQDGAKETTTVNGRELTDQQVRQVDELQSRDQEVRSHEQAHKAAAGRHAAGAISLSTTQGPDGRQYATGGEIAISTGKENSPEATIQKMQTVKRAALAPAEPSAADRSIAIQATQTELDARMEIRTLTADENKEAAEKAQELREKSEQEATEQSNKSEASTSDQEQDAIRADSDKKVHDASEAISATNNIQNAIYSGVNLFA